MRVNGTLSEANRMLWSRDTRILDVVLNACKLDAVSADYKLEVCACAWDAGFLSTHWHVLSQFWLIVFGMVLVTVDVSAWFKMSASFLIIMNGLITEMGG